MSQPFALLLLTCIALPCLAQVAEPPSPAKPNIIVIYTDDHGYPDLGCMDILDDVKTPHIDALAQGGVRMTSGYCSAPQCGPSRAGLISGQYQNRFGMEANGDYEKDPAVLERFRALASLPERLQAAGYATGFAGKSHLGTNDSAGLVELGFDKAFFKHSNAPGHWNMDLQGNDLQPQQQVGGAYHLEMISEFACTFVDRYKDQPFFFYLACRAPHVPLDATQKYLDRFPGEMPERRRQALAMISAVDDGVGQIVERLEHHGLMENTLIFVISDNGAPLKIHKVDAPGGGPGWDGSLNDPLNGEKGMLTEGGIRVPYVVYWQGTIPGGQVYDQPVITLDVAATANALAGLADDPILDGVNLIPFLTGQNSAPPHEALYWRWLSQAAIRKGDWKYLVGNDRAYLFDLSTDKEETTNLIEQHPDKAAVLRADLEAWADTLDPPGIGSRVSPSMSLTCERYFDWYLDGIREQPAAPNSEEAEAADEAPRPAGPDDAGLFRRRDKDGDERVTWEEFLAGRSGDKVPILRRNFQRRDTNGNGVWEKEEIE